MDLNRLDYKKIVLILALAYLVIRIPIIASVPLMQDESFYSVMIEEQISHLTTVVTLFNEPVGWKPPLFFWISGFFVQFLRDLPIPIEAVYRIPNVLFGLVNTILVFFIFEKITKKKDEAFLMALAYLTIGINIHSELRVLTDTMCGTFIFAGVLCYINGLKDSKLFLLGGVCTFLAYFVKQHNAAIVPIIAVAYFFQCDRKKLLTPLFLLSLAAFPLAIIIEDMNFGFSAGGVTTVVAGNTLIKNLKWESVVASIIGIYPYAVVLLTLSVFGIWKSWKENFAMSVWYLLMAFPLIAGTYMPFYFYSVVPPIAYFAIKYLSKDGHKTKMDKFFYVIYSIGLVLGLILGIMAHFQYQEAFQIQKNAGEFLAGKENVMIIGMYYPGVPAYKMLEERRANGSWLDYGLIIPGNVTTQTLQAFVDNYWVENDRVEDANFRWAFVNPDRIYRKNTSVDHFDYICLLGNMTENVTVNGEMVYQEETIRVYKTGN
ncbi:Dolichyl-phosphate-mannose-protein mannosyltransferase [Candidatus Bilamarchaeum dharawalense]|uniref:Dolichyl-phosphate-mannose-protein mannosyltransferase n=1 Tax=Candidatus Bilamarchaeum dharawalense TaxID=2885759 RepID=A0A5E4LQN4_9ARCH|nr:Dolichyl-phosphate-mannose-protein mannosyltransferase [Candidatus Bilamarchaeum dharawalense]